MRPFGVDSIFFVIKLSVVYHLHLQAISRSDGRSATAAAAYRSGENVHDDLRGKTHRYENRRGVIHSEILGSKLNRSELWNSAERVENRKNSIVARELTIALPAELDSAARISAAREFARWLSDTYEVAVDLAVHAPHKSGDQRNHHAHLLFTARPIIDDVWAKKKDRRWNARDGHNTTECLRERWSSIVQPLVHNPDNWDHRSHESRGIATTPTRHVGPRAMNLQRNGNTSDRYDQIIKQSNDERNLEAQLLKIKKLIQLEEPNNGIIREIGRRSAIDRQINPRWPKFRGSIIEKSGDIEKGSRRENEIGNANSRDRGNEITSSRVRSRVAKIERRKSAFETVARGAFTHGRRRAINIHRKCVFARSDDTGICSARRIIDAYRRRTAGRSIPVEQVRGSARSIFRKSKGLKL